MTVPISLDEVQKIAEDVAGGVTLKNLSTNTYSDIITKVRKGVEEAKDKIVKRNTINQTNVAILKDGYYEVNGFKFTEYYYNKLWNTGRGAPSLVANEVVNNAQSIEPDMISGFFKYKTSDWEVVWNPSTGEVTHMQPL